MLLEMLIKKVAHCLWHLEGDDLAVLSWWWLGILVICVCPPTQEETKQCTSEKNILGKQLRFKPPQDVDFLGDERLQKHNL